MRQLWGGVNHAVLRILHDIIYQFHMPLMFFISGMLSGKLQKITTTSERVIYIKDRFRRLMVPYFSIAIFYLPCKMLLSNFANQPYDICSIWKIFLGENPDGGLWFLYVLFLIQVVMCIVLKNIGWYQSFSISIIIALLIVFLDTKWFRVDDALFYLPFVVGGLCYVNSPIYKKKMSRLLLILLFLFWGISLCVFIKTSSPYCRLFSGFSGSMVIIAISRYANMKTLWSICMKTLGRYTMEIYIFHGILMVIVRILCYSVLEMNYYVCCMIMLTVGLILPIYISRCLMKKTPILRMLFLGEYKSYD